MPKTKLKLNAKQLRQRGPRPGELDQIKRLPISIILDNIQDTFNIGSFFRLAEAIAAEKLYLCGDTVSPPNIKIHRASVGTWRWLPWEYHRSPIKLIKELKKKGYLVVAAEQAKKSIPYTKLKLKTPVALVVGHESNGISKEVLAIVDQIIELPLLGINRSLNVLVAASVILYHWLEQLGITRVKEKTNS